MTPYSPNWSPDFRSSLVVALIVCVVGSATLAGALVAESSTGDDAADTRTDAEPLTLGETITANLSDGDDVDWYAVNATAGEVVIAELGLRNYSESEYDGRSIEVNVYGPDGVRGTEEERDKSDSPERVAGRRYTGTFEPIAHAPDVAEANGTYYIQVKEFRLDERAENVSSPYNLTVTTEPLDQYDPNENGTTATRLDVGQTIEGVTAPYDQDVFAVNLTEGQNYTVTVNGTNFDGGYFDKVLSLHTNVSNVTDDRPSQGMWRRALYGGASETFTAPENGTHYLRLGKAGTTLVLLERDDYRLTVVPANSSSDDANNGSDGDADDGSGDGPDDGADGDTGGDGAADDGSGDGSDCGCNPTATPGDGGDGGAGDGATSTPTATDAYGSGGGNSTATDTSATDNGTAMTTTTGTGVAGPGFGVVATLLALTAGALLALRPDAE